MGYNTQSSEGFGNRTYCYQCYAYYIEVSNATLHIVKDQTGINKHLMIMITILSNVNPAAQLKLVLCSSRIRYICQINNFNLEKKLKNFYIIENQLLIT